MITPYKKFRTGYTYQEISSMIWSDSDDPNDWHPGSAKTVKFVNGVLVKTKGRRHTILGKWHEIKKQMYEEYLRQFEEVELPF